MVELSLASRLSPFALSLFSSPKVLPPVPSLAELQKNAVAFGAPIVQDESKSNSKTESKSDADTSKSWRGRLPSYSSTAKANDDSNDNNDPYRGIGTRGVKIPSTTITANSTPPTSRSNSNSWFSDPFSRTDPSITASASPPPAYSADLSSTIALGMGGRGRGTWGAGALRESNKLRKTRSGYTHVQAAIPGEGGRPRMEGGKVYADSVISQPSIGDMRFGQEDKPTLWEWLTCRA